jgi:hypothetical protein
LILDLSLVGGQRISRPTPERNCPRTRSCWATLVAVSLLTDLDAFFADHHQCGELDAGVDERIVWMACDCGARMARRVDEDDHAGRVARCP